MFKFDNKLGFLFFLIFIPIAYILKEGYRKRKEILKFFDVDYCKVLNLKRYIFIIFGLALLLLSITSPSILTNKTNIRKREKCIYLILDISNSMLAEDVFPNRLEAAKRCIKLLMNGFHGEKVGFILSAADAYLQMPLTDDYKMALKFLNVIKVGMAPDSGSNLAVAIKLADSSLKKINAKGQVVIFSDGEDNGLAIEEAKNAGNSKIFTVSIGTEAGATIPMFDESSAKLSVMLDRNGIPVITKADLNYMKRLAYIGGGDNFKVDELSKLSKSIAKANVESDTTGNSHGVYKLIYQWFLLLAILSILAGYLSSRYRGDKLEFK